MSTRTTRPSTLTSGDLAFPALLTSLALAFLLFAWTWGALAALAVGHGPPVGLLDAGGALLRLPFHADDPARAFAADGHGLPGPAVMWAAFLATIALGWTAVILLIPRLADRLGHHRPGPWARWAKPRDLHALMVRPGQHGDRTILGSVAGRPVAAERQVSTIVIAPTRSGKTSGLMIPAILEHQGPVIATSVKGDLLATAAHRQTMGEVRVFDPTGATGWPASGWSPVAASQTWLGARRTADRLLRQARQGNGSHTDFWQGMGMRFLAPLLFAAAQGGASMRDVLRWVELVQQDEPRAALQSVAETAEGFGALTSLESLWREDHRIRGSVVQTVATALEAYQDAGVMQAASRHDITADWLLDPARHHTLYVIAPADDQERLEGVFAALLTDLIAAAFAKATEQGRPLDPVLQCVLDEAPYIARLPNLARIASTGAGEGIRLLTAAQTMSQFVERWGQAEAETIIAGHPSRIFGAGLSDPTSLSYLRTALGDEEIQTLTHRGGLGQTDRTHATTFRPLVDGPTARQRDRTTGILVYGTLPPARLRLRPWFQDRRLRKMVETTSPATRTAHAAGRPGTEEADAR
ncbi:type IV secretory system conjugative DNA transfer family protein [Patulibacter brassicae]|uniref:Type IV secretory system conjugative DNA transfer family protein n=1 Tax=Patulibacter brassicae TaxID=1705717 RepID=A0ABU4VP03_9ACTN|nr:type IV secretory system conjugative DNA transfer family protein [Patulibacter brassicae]MDX8153359.1 type IV secretory system conjugative DNA transfer family protein [Patulibacter brassicae]